MMITNIVNRVMNEVPNSNTLSVQAEIVDGCIEFCRQTWIWQVETAAWVRKGRKTGVIRKAANISIIGLVSWESQHTSTPPTLYRGEEVSIPYVTESDIQYSLAVAVVPADIITDIPDWLYVNHGKAIIAYAKHSLLMMRDKSWTDPGRAQTLHAQFTDAVNATKREINNARMLGNNRVRIGA